MTDLSNLTDDQRVRLASWNPVGVTASALSSTANIGGALWRYSMGSNGLHITASAGDTTYTFDPESDLEENADFWQLDGITVDPEDNTHYLISEAGVYSFTEQIAITGKIGDTTWTAFGLSSIVADIVFVPPASILAATGMYYTRTYVGQLPAGLPVGLKILNGSSADLTVTVTTDIFRLQ